MLQFIDLSVFTVSPLVTNCIRVRIHDYKIQVGNGFQKADNDVSVLVYVTLL